MKRLLKPLPLVALVLGTLPAMLPTTVAYAEEGEAQKPKPVYPPISKTEMQTPAFDLALRADTQTLAHLSPKGNTAFDFVPAGREPERAGDGYVHIGDIHIRLKTAGSDWQDFSSAHARKQIAALAGGNGVLAAADITASMGAGMPLRVERRWVNEAGVLAMRFTLVNTSSAAVEIGGLGMPMVFDNIILDRDLDTAHAEASFVDPYIGRDAGYLQVTRLNGQGPALLVLPEKGTPLEAYRPIIEARAAKNGDIFTDRSQRSQVSEGFYDWTVASKGFAEKEWAKAGQQWNEPTSITLAPGESRTIGLRFVTAPDIRKIEDTLVANKRPVAVGIPGYVVPTDQTASLFLKTPSKVAKIESFPEGALTATSEKSGTGWARYQVKASGWGQARLTVTYADGQKQTVSYYITKPLEQVMADIGQFTTTNQWFEGRDDEGRGDPFHRSPAILSYDREDNKILTQDGRVWVSGMSDEGGAGSWVAAMMKQLDNPSPEEVAKLERLVNETVLGTLQVKDGPQAGAVKKSIFYYDPVEFPNYYDPKINWKSWTAWSKKDSDDLGRSYNYPHVAIGHWVLYRLARDNQGLVKQHDWKFYLEWAYRTSVAMMRDAPYYAQFGQMEGDVFLDILKDLKREGLTAEATEMEGLMKGRADHWRTLKFPFGSEMAWDSTGQPEVYAWMRYFGYQPQADETREVILAYDPTIPNWGYNGNARRYWDFLYGGKVSRIERQIHHYGSALNAVPLFDAYRQNPGDLHLLRVAYGGMMGGITNIDQQGFGSAAFHSWPDMMKWDAITGDYGMGFYGHAITSATYMVSDPQFGWLGFGGDLTTKGGKVHIEPKDGARRRLFIAPAGLWITLEAGRIKSADYDAKTGKIVLTLDPASTTAPTARLLFETTTAGGKTYGTDTGTADRGGYAIALGTGETAVTLSPR